jgi:hypothetical protein
LRITRSKRDTKQLAIYQEDVDVIGDRVTAGRSVLTFALSLPNATADSEAAVVALFDTNVDLGKNTVGCRFTSDTKVSPEVFGSLVSQLLCCCVDTRRRLRRHLAMTAPFPWYWY